MFYFIYFTFLSKDNTDLEELVKKFIKIGPKIKDPLALQALSVSLAKLSTDNKYMSMLEKHGLLNPLTEQLFILMEICKVISFTTFFIRLLSEILLLRTMIVFMHFCYVVVT